MTTKPRILIIDDEADLAWMLKLNLEKTKLYEVSVETDPAKGVHAAREFAPDLVLLDLILPQTTGGELATQLKTALAPATLPIVFLTAALPRPEPDGKPRTMAGYRVLSKPIDLQHLLDCVATELQHQPAVVATPLHRREAGRLAGQEGAAIHPESFRGRERRGYNRDG